MLNHSVMMGRLVADPELKHTQTGVPVCSIRIAVDRDYKKNGETETDFFDVVAWRGTAEFICNYFTKGRMIVVEGRMQTRNWTDKEGGKRVAIELVADNAYFGDSKRDTGNGGNQGADDYPAPAPNGYSGPMPGGVPGDYAPDFV